MLSFGPKLQIVRSALLGWAALTHVGRKKSFTYSTFTFQEFSAPSGKRKVIARASVS